MFLLLQYTQGAHFLLASQTISFACGFVVSFLLNRSWVFRSEGGAGGELLRYALLAAINLVASNGALAIMVNGLGLPPPTAKFLVMGMVAAWNYLIFSRLIFRTGKCDKPLPPA
ncbi:GtrA family protein [Stenotrophomonas maltophilia]|nr:GtrA family protein [Stenotrophomonas maltophilia]